MWRVLKVYLESGGKGCWNSSSGLDGEGLSGHRFGLARFWGYGLKNGNLKVFRHKGGHCEFWCGLVRKIDLDPFYVSYMRCWEWFWGQIVDGLGYAILRSMYVKCRIIGLMAILRTIWFWIVMMIGAGLVCYLRMVGGLWGWLNGRVTGLVIGLSRKWRKWSFGEGMVWFGVLMDLRPKWLYTHLIHVKYGLLEVVLRHFEDRLSVWSCRLKKVFLG